MPHDDVPNDDPIARELHEWSGTTLGQALIQQEREQLDAMLAKLYGPIAIQYGAPGFSQFLQSTNAIRRIHSMNGRNSGERDLSGSLLYSLPSAMPFDAKSVNLLVLPHVLEFSADPHQVLREAERVLVPEGHLVLICFNPTSLWGIHRSIARIIKKESPAPWRGQFFGLSRVKEWLSVLGFEVISGSSVCFVPPVKSTNVRARLEFLDKAGARWWPMWAAVFILVVRKTEIGHTPLVVGWTRRKRIAPGLAEPATRNG